MGEKPGVNRWNGNSRLWAKPPPGPRLLFPSWPFVCVRIGTGLGKLGIAPHIAEAALNHLSPKLIRTYDRNRYKSEKQQALDLWAAHLKVCIAQANGTNVTAIRKASIKPRP